MGLFFVDVADSADSDVYHQYDDNPDDILLKTKMYFHAWDVTDCESWITKGRLFKISIGAHSRVGYYYYVGGNKSDRFITDGSFRSAVRIFEEEGLSKLNTNTIREIVSGFLFRIMVNPDMNDIVCKSYYTAYKRGVASKGSPVTKSDLSVLQKLIGADTEDPVVVQSNESTGRWTATFFVVTGSGQIESWKFSGTNDGNRFTVDTLDRKLLGVKVKRLQMTG